VSGLGGRSGRRDLRCTLSEATVLRGQVSLQLIMLLIPLLLGPPWAQSNCSSRSHLLPLHTPSEHLGDRLTRYSCERSRVLQSKAVFYLRLQSSKKSSSQLLVRRKLEGIVLNEVGRHSDQTHLAERNLLNPMRSVAIRVALSPVRANWVLQVSPPDRPNSLTLTDSPYSGGIF
jgi:hypothetical protein